MENLSDLSLADLTVLHEQMLKEEGYAGQNRKEWYAARIAEIVNEKNRRLPDDMRANIMGGVVPATYDDGSGQERAAAVSAQVLADPDLTSPKGDPTQDTPTQQKTADVNKASGSGVVDTKAGTPESKPKVGK